jgi:hypothetical protein
VVNAVLRRGLEASAAQAARASYSYREQTFALGAPRVPLDKALSIAASLEDEEVIEKLARRK